MYFKNMGNFFKTLLLNKTREQLLLYYSVQLFIFATSNKQILQGAMDAFSVPIEKEVAKIDKNGNEITKTISYRLQFTDSARFIASSLSNLAKNVVEGIHKIKCKYGHDDKESETCRIKYKDCDCFLNVQILSMI